MNVWQVRGGNETAEAVAGGEHILVTQHAANMRCTSSNNLRQPAREATADTSRPTTGSKLNVESHLMLRHQDWAHSLMARTQIDILQMKCRGAVNIVQNVA